MVKLTISDKIVGVVQASMVLLTSMCNKTFFQPKLFGAEKDEVVRHGDLILEVLVDKLGENLVKTRKGAEEAIISMCKN